MEKKSKMLFYLFLLSCYVFSQNIHKTDSKMGKVVGFVVDSLTNSPLVGANVFLEGTNLGAAADLEGEFIIYNIPPGEYSLNVNYIGYKDKQFKIKIEPGKTHVIKAKLSWVAMTGEVIEVTAQAKGQMAAINQQISAKAIKNVVSASRIQELPDANAAESLGRLVGVSIDRSGGEAATVNVRGLGGGANAVYVDGMRIPGVDLGGNGRGVGLANISSQMIGGIELQKSFTPDHDADVVGGIINFKLKEAEEGFHSEVFFKQGYNGFSKSFLMNDFAISLSNRFFDNKLGVIVNGVWDRKDRGTDFLSAGYIITKTPQNSDEIVPVKLSNVSLRHRLEKRSRLGFTMNWDYKFSTGKITGQTFLSQMNRNVEEHINLYDDNKNITYDANKFDQKDKYFLLGIAGNKNIFSGIADFRFYHSEALTNRPFERSIHGDLVDVIDNGPENGPEKFIKHGSHDATQARVKNTKTKKSDNDAFENSLDINYKLLFNLTKNINGYFKFGGKSKDTKRKYYANGSILEYGVGALVNGIKVLRDSFTDWEWIITSNGNISHANFVNNFSPIKFGSGKYLFYYPVDFKKLDFVINKTKDRYVRNWAAEANNYNTEETIKAFYVMSDINLGKYLSILPGVRYEHYQITTNALKFTQTQGPQTGFIQGDFDSVKTTTINKYWLPMINLKFQPFDWFDIRFAWSKTLQRPGFLKYSPRMFITKNRDVFMGNPNLKPQRNENYDSYLSFYTNNIGLFTLGGFYKKFQGQIFSYTVTMFNPQKYGFSEEFKGRKLTMEINNKWPGSLYGIEVDWQTHLWYLPKPFNGIILNINYTHMYSKTRYPFFYYENTYLSEPPWVVTITKDSSRVNKITNMPDDIANLSLGYEHGGFSGRVSLYYQGYTIQNAQNVIKSLDRNKDKILRWDVQLSQKVSDHLQLYLNLNNITDWPDRQYLTFHKNLITSQEYYGWGGDFGIRYRF